MVSGGINWLDTLSIAWAQRHYNESHVSPGELAQVEVRTTSLPIYLNEINSTPSLEVVDIYPSSSKIETVTDRLDQETILQQTVVEQRVSIVYQNCSDDDQCRIGRL